MSSTPIIRSDDLRTENRYRILGTLRREGTLSRAALGERTSLSQAAISTLIGQLAAEGALESGAGPSEAAANGRRGRPQTLVALAPCASAALTVSLSIDRLRLALVDYAGTETLVRDRRLDTRALDARALLRRVVDGVARLARLAPGGRVAHIGVAFQGMTENASGDLLWSPVLRVREVPLGRVLARRFGVPTSVNNDCALIARALRQRHADALGDDFATVLFGHGVGLGLTLGGRSFAGIRSSALEIGHLPFERGGARCRCGRLGCIEAYAADYGIVRTADAGAPHSAPPGRVDRRAVDVLVGAARDGDARARKALALAGTAVGEGLSTLFTLLDPMPVALVGRSDEALAMMSDALCGALDAAGHGAEAPPALIGFEDDEPLLHAGLALDTLDAVDRLVATRASAGATGPVGDAAPRRRPARA